MTMRDWSGMIKNGGGAKTWLHVEVSDESRGGEFVRIQNGNFDERIKR
jgi:hypothetical protein